MKSGKFASFNRTALKAALASALVVAGAGLVNNAYALDANASANVVEPITVAETRALNFGKFVASSGGTVILTNVDVTVPTGTSVRVSPSTAASGKFTVTGDGAATYTITVDATVTLNGGTVPSSMTATLTKSASNALSGLTGTTGTDVVYVGGTLTQGASNGPGAYTGTYAVTVAYN